MASPVRVAGAAQYAAGAAGAAVTVTVSAPPGGQSLFLDGYETSVTAAAVTDATNVVLNEGSNVLSAKAFPAAAAIGEQRGTIFATPLGPFDGAATLVIGAPGGSTVMKGFIYYHYRQ